MTVQSDIGPSAQPRWRVYKLAREVQALAELARELSAEGPKCNVPRALAQLDRIRAVLGTSGTIGAGD
ncbi:hypothetical protein [Novosphingobium sp.]|uniref:hypothetical protein n=1 Tax=Novosphingobium sp. TaxID=1874826 RepID=UPI0038BD93E3